MILENIVVKSVLLDCIKEVQEKDFEVQKRLEKVNKGKKSDFNLKINGVLRFRNRIVVPKDEGLKRKILEKRIDLSIRYTLKEIKCTKI